MPLDITLTAREAAQLAGDLLRAVSEAADHEMSYPVTILRGQPRPVIWVSPIPGYKRAHTTRSWCWSMNRYKSNAW